MLHPRLQLVDPPGEEVASLRRRWQERPSLRIERFLADEVALDLREALRQCDFDVMTPQHDEIQFRYQYGVHAQVPDEVCDHVLCGVGRWLWSDGAAWLSRLTGHALAPPDDRLLVATLYSRGSYLDPHNDVDGRRKVAFVLGLTDASWPAEDGGHLEFLAAGGGGEVVERRAPGWNTLDLFEVVRPIHIHQVPIVTRDVERRAITGWFF
jgi:hypothetical protein